MSDGAACLTRFWNRKTFLFFDGRPSRSIRPLATFTPFPSLATFTKAFTAGTLSAGPFSAGAFTAEASTAASTSASARSAEATGATRSARATSILSVDHGHQFVAGDRLVAVFVGALHDPSHASRKFIFSQLSVLVLVEPHECRDHLIGRHAAARPSRSAATSSTAKASTRATLSTELTTASKLTAATELTPRWPDLVAREDTIAVRIEFLQGVSRSLNLLGGDLTVTVRIESGHHRGNTAGKPARTARTTRAFRTALSTGAVGTWRSVGALSQGGE